MLNAKLERHLARPHALPHEISALYIVRTRFDLDPTQEWIQAHVAQTMNL